MHDNDRQHRLAFERYEKVYRFQLHDLGDQRHHYGARNDLREHPSHLPNFKWCSDRQFRHANIILGELHR